LHAHETILYINNSPDSLEFLFFHLWPNAYSDNKTALARQLFSWQGRSRLFDNRFIRGYIDSLDFRIDDEPVQWRSYNGKNDFCILELKEPLAPGDSVVITTPFHVKIPAGNISRLGHIGQSYQISQWYPKPAVYDRNGWHPMDYLDQGEFYSEFGKYSVTISLPVNYTVCASGDLVSGIEERLNTPTSDSFSSSQKMKTVVYQREKIHDFAWFAGNDYYTIHGKTKLPSGREVITKAVFTSGNAYSWTFAPEFISDALYSLSQWIGDYPYESFTAVEAALGAGSGMEYPGLAVIGSVNDPYSLDEVIVHEACHSWFYSSIASDERRYPFIDEGITTAYEVRYMYRKYPGKKLWEVYFKNPKLTRAFNLEEVPVERLAELEWLIGERNNTSQPAFLSSEFFTETNYNNIVYYKAGQGFSYLRSYLGDELFDRIIHEFYSEWASAHPGPSDLRRVFESGTGKDMSWFFDDFIGTTKRFDYSIDRIKDNQVLVRNRGEMVSPFPLTGKINDSVVFDIWSDGFAGKKWIALPGTGFSELQINSKHLIPEVNYLNNNIKSEGIFRKSDPIRIHLLAGFEDPAERTLFVIPLVNWNRIDGFMPGVAVSNKIILPGPFEFYLMPFYSFRNQSLTGKGRVAVNILPYNIFFRKVTIFSDGSLFGAPGNNKFHMLRTGIDLHIRNRNMNFSSDHSFFGRYINASDITLLLSEENNSRNFWQAGYMLSRSLAIDPYNLTAMFESGSDYRKGTLEFRYTYSYAGKGNGLDLRLFSGYMFRQDKLNSLYSLAPSARSGRELYLFQGEFPDRYAVFPTGFWSRQMVSNEGGIISPINDKSGYSKWLFSASMTASLPGRAAKLPVRPFINMLYKDNSHANTDHLFMEAGLSAGLRDIFEFHIPLLVTGNIHELRSTVKERIRFVFNLEPLYNFRLGQ
jgi:hypothetical protein